MKILLTHGYFLRDDPKELKIMRPYPPLGLLSVSAYLTEKGVEHEVFDSTFSTFDSLMAHIRSTQPGIIAIYVNLMTRKNVVRMIKEVKASKSLDVKFILGGPETRYHIEEFLDHGADALVVGEGEESALELIQALNSGKKLQEVEGIAFRNNGTTVTTNERAKLKDLDLLPFPARDKIDLKPYLTVWKDKHGGSSVSISTMRGCPYTCKWCSRAVYGLSYRRMSPQRVVDELQNLIKRYSPDRFWFVDDVFTVSHKWMREFVEEVERRNVDIQYECITRADRLNEEVIAQLKRSGCFRVWIGAESGSQRIIDKMDRRVDVGKVGEMIRSAKNAGMEAGTFIMLGYPGETEEDIKATIEHLKASNPDQFTITMTYPIKGTELWQEVEGIQTTTPDWATSSDRDVDFERRYSKRFYEFAVRRVVNEVQYNKMKVQGQHKSVKAFKLRLKYNLAKAGMYLQKR